MVYIIRILAFAKLSGSVASVLLRDQLKKESGLLIFV